MATPKNFFSSMLKNKNSRVLVESNLKNLNSFELKSFSFNFIQISTESFMFVL